MNSNQFGGAQNNFSMGANNNGGFGGFQSASAAPNMSQQPASNNNGQYYGGLVDLAPKGPPKQPGKILHPPV